MSNGRKAFTSLLCIGFLLGIGNKAFSFEYCGFKYHSLPVRFYFNSSGTSDVSGDGEFDALTASFNTWQNVSHSSWTWSYQGETSDNDYGSRDGKNICGWTYSLGSGVIGVCTIYYDDDQIFDTDIAFNQDFEWSVTGEPDAMDVQNIATHEIGHTLCLDDLYDSEDSEKTMYGFGDEGETKQRTLHEDDMDGIRYIYSGTKPTPPPTPTPTPTPPTPPTPPPPTPTPPTPPNPSPPTPFLLGDVSGDGEISPYDAALTAQASVGLITLTAEQTQAADVSGNSKVSTYDAALIAQKAVGLIDKFPGE